MKIFNINQIRDWDAFTIENEPIPSVDLMERAASKVFKRIKERYGFNSYAIVCGPGNNGGDGLVIARYLEESDIPVKVLLPAISENYSSDFKKNLERLPKELIQEIPKDSSFDFNAFDCIIDSIFGSGLARPLNGFVGDIVGAINESEAYVISIDIPSGLYADIDKYPLPDVFVSADTTYTFQIKKSSFFNEELRSKIGEIEVVDIGLLQDYSERQATDIYEIDQAAIQIKGRSRFTHKFAAGFALIIGGSRGKYGAPILSAKAAMRAGAGLVSVAIPKEGRDLVHISMNELMVVDAKGDSFLKSVDIPQKVNAIGIGPGLDTNEASINVIRQAFESECPLVIDADALNLISNYPELWKSLPEESIVTPHFGEFQRLFGKISGEESKYDVLKKQAKIKRIYIILKGAITAIASPDGDLYFLDEVGNSGMATAGSGDVLTGVITSLLAQGYSSLEASVYGVYIHGYAGDLSVVESEERSMVASDLINHIGKAIKNLTD